MTATWTEVPLGDVAEIVSGITKGRKPNGQPMRTVPYLAVANVQDRHLRLTSVKSIQATEAEIERYRLKPGDLLLTEGGDPDKLGRGTVWSGELPECIHQNHVFRVRIHDPGLIPSFVSRLIASDRGRRYFLRSAKQTTGIASINKTQLAALPLVKPPLEEQRRIVSILDSADELRAERQESITLLDSVAISIVRKLLAQAADSDWPTVALGDLGDIQGGLQVTQKRASNPIEVPYLRVANVYRGHLDLRELKTIRVTLAELDRTRLLPGDLLVVEGHGNADEIGRVGRWSGATDPMVHQNHLIRVRLDARAASPTFIEAFLNSPTGRRSLLRAARTTSGLNTISTGREVGIGAVASAHGATSVRTPDGGDGSDAKAVKRPARRSGRVVRFTAGEGVSGGVVSTPFEFLRAEFPLVHEGAVKAGAAALTDPRAACFHARWTIEQAIKWAFEHDRSLGAPYDDGVSALLHDPAFKALIGERVFRFAKETIQLGNRAVHEARAPTQHDSVAAVSHLFQFCYWFGRTYCRGEKPPADLTFDPRSLPRPCPPQPSTTKQIEELQQALDESERARKRVQDELIDTAKLEAELERVRAEVTEAKAQAAATADEHDYSEAETRDYFIDLLLAEVGWALDQPRDREFEVTGMPTGDGRGYVDYVLWGDDGKPLAVVEAKRTKRDARQGQQQAKLYADCLEQAYSQRPVIFYSNGYEHWIWDDAFYPPRQVQGFRTRDELELLVRRRTARASLAETEIDSSIADRYYQTRSIRRIGESFERDHARKALVVMATGAGKTRTVVALSDLLIRANWAKRILFLADRTALVNQATNVFKQLLPDSSPVNLVTDRREEGRVYVSTYPTMLNLINELRDSRRRFGPGYFDLVVIDEAHRSVFQKYRAIFDYFDSLLVGLTATPRDEVDRNTYGLFDLEPGVPTDAYGLDEAVADGFLVPPRAVSVPLRFQREGIRYDDLSNEEKDLWDGLDWDDEGGDPPDEVGAEAINRWLFNDDTVDKVLAHLMTHGLKVAGGDRLGKTIIFAKNQAHADFIAERFDLNYPHLRGEFARVITHSTEYAQDLIDKFSIPDRDPRIAISVDMLDTGIDVPEVVNVVFFKLVRSKTKFWQMIGRGTRLCPDVFGPGQDKTFFYLFDYCQNLEFFNQNPEAAEGSLAPSLGAQVFTGRLDLLATLDAANEHPKERRSIAELLRTEVAAMNVGNVVVRPHRRLVERFSSPEAWETLGVGEASDLARNVAGLPAAIEPEAEETKRFDLLVLHLELALLRTEPSFPRLRQQVQAIAHILEGYPTIPAVAKELALIADVQDDEWWVDVTLPMLEQVRRRLRLLVPFIEKRKRKIVYTDFTDTLGDATEVAIGGLVAATNGFERFRRKTRQFLAEHKNHVAVEKLHRNRPITDTDLDELKRVLVDNGIGTDGDLERATEEAGSFGIFIRSLVGLDRSAAKEAFADFLDAKHSTANQIEFVNLVIDHLTENGIIEPRRFYESPFTDLSPTGPDALFESTDVDLLLQVVANIRHNADAA